jgi:hypothetical protein
MIIRLLHPLLWDIQLKSRAFLIAGIPVYFVSSKGDSWVPGKIHPLESSPGMILFPGSIRNFELYIEGDENENSDQLHRQKKANQAYEKPVEVLEIKKEST